MLELLVIVYRIYTVYLLNGSYTLLSTYTSHTPIQFVIKDTSTFAKLT